MNVLMRTIEVVGHSANCTYALPMRENKGELAGFVLAQQDSVCGMTTRSCNNVLTQSGSPLYMLVVSAADKGG